MPVIRHTLELAAAVELTPLRIAALLTVRTSLSRPVVHCELFELHRSDTIPENGCNQACHAHILMHCSDSHIGAVTVEDVDRTASCMRYGKRWWLMPLVQV